MPNPDLISLFSGLSPWSIVMIAISTAVSFHQLTQIVRSARVPAYGAMLSVITFVLQTLVWVLGNWWIWLATVSVTIPVSFLTLEEWAPKSTRDAWEVTRSMGALAWIFTAVMSAALMFLFQLIR